MGIFDRATDIPDPQHDPMPDEQKHVLDKVAIQVVRRSLTVPAIVFLESIKPLNYITAQAMVFFEPIIQSIFNWRDYDNLRNALERRESIEMLILRIEAKDAVQLKREKAIKKFLKAQKKDWKWYQRWLGIARPKITYPDELKNLPPELDLKKVGELPESGTKPDSPGPA